MVTIHLAGLSQSSQSWQRASVPTRGELPYAALTDTCVKLRINDEGRFATIRCGVGAHGGGVGAGILGRAPSQHHRARCCRTIRASVAASMPSSAGRAVAAGAEVLEAAEAQFLGERTGRSEDPYRPRLAHFDAHRERLARTRWQRASRNTCDRFLTAKLWDVGNSAPWGHRLTHERDRQPDLVAERAGEPGDGERLPPRVKRRLAAHHARVAERLAEELGVETASFSTLAAATPSAASACSSTPARPRSR